MCRCASFVAMEDFSICFDFNDLNVEYYVVSILMHGKAQKYKFWSICTDYTSEGRTCGGKRNCRQVITERRADSLMFSSSSTSMLVGLLWPESSRAPAAPGRQKTRQCDSISVDSDPHAQRPWGLHSLRRRARGDKRHMLQEASSRWRWNINIQSGRGGRGWRNLIAGAVYCDFNIPPIRPHFPLPAEKIYSWWHDQVLCCQTEDSSWGGESD